MNRDATFADLGMTVRVGTPEALRQAGFHGDLQGVIVDSVRPGSPAAAAGMRPGMFVERIDTKEAWTAARPSIQGAGINGTGPSEDDEILLYVHTGRGPRFVAIGKGSFLLKGRS